MQDSDYVHKRDITTILTQLQEDIQETKNELANPDVNSKEIESQINKLITEADRDLRLKTHVLVRNKLSKSRMMPFLTPDSTNNSLRQTEVQAMNKSAPVSPVNTIVKPRPIKTSFGKGMSNLTINVQSTNNLLNPTPHSPISSTPTPCLKRIAPLSTSPLPTRVRSSSMNVATRRRNLPTFAKHELPLINKHDPLQPPPPIPPDAIKNYGLNRLIDSGLLPMDALSNELNDLVITYPISKDPPIVLNDQQSYILDQTAKPDTIKLVDYNAANSTTSDRRLNTQNTENQKTMSEEDMELIGKWPFVLINGRPDNSDPDFATFKLKNSNRWEQVEIILDLLRLICQEYGLTKQKIIGSVVIELTQLDPDSVSQEKLLRCFVNRNFKRTKKQTKVGFGFIGPNAEHKAAAVIQSIWRGFHARRTVRKIRKVQAARRIIGRFFKKAIALKKFRSTYKADFKRKMMNFEACQSSPEMLYRHDVPYTVVHIIEGHHGAEFGRLSMLSDPNCSLIFFTRKKVLPCHLEYIKTHVDDANRVQLVAAQQRLPRSLPIEDVLASDNRSLTKIRDISRGTVVHIQPSRIRDSIVEVTLKLAGLAIVPNRTKTVMFSTRDAVRRHLKNAGAKLFECSDEIFDKETLCKVLTNLTVTNLAIHQWKIRLSTGGIGWVNTSDFVLLERLRANSEMLTEKDLEDEHFRNLLEQSLSNDLKVILETTGNTPKEEFLREVWMGGGFVEAAPRQVACCPSVAVYVPPVGMPQIIGSWENIFQSIYEPFASILPAFNLDLNKLKKSTAKISDMLYEKRMVGYNIIDYWYSARTTYNSIDEEKVKMRLTADDLRFAQFESLLPIFLVEHFTGKKFDVETMSFGPNVFAYVQEKLVLPRHIEPDALMQKLTDESLPTKNKISIIQDITDNTVFSLIVVETSFPLLITLVYRIFVTLIDRIFNGILKPNDPLYLYIFAIEYLKAQVDENHLHSTALTNKVRNKDWEKRPVNKNNKTVSFFSPTKKNPKEKSLELLDFE